MLKRVCYLSFAMQCVFVASGPWVNGEDAIDPIIVSQRAQELHRSALLIDGHNDLPWKMRDRSSLTFDKLDLAKHQPELHTDIPRLLEGGVGAQFWSVYVPVSTMSDGVSLSMTLEQIDFVDAMMKKFPDTFELALTVQDIRRIHASGKIASLIGVEGGHAIENSLNVLHQLYRRGARYMTLTHSKNLDWADSATDDPSTGGLTPFGEEVIREMNRLGMMVDLSHVSPATMKHALRITQSPILFSHSSARAVADHPRNVPDDVLNLTAKNNGVVMVNFYPSFVVPEAAKLSVQRLVLAGQLKAELADEDEIDRRLDRWDAEHPRPTGSIHDVVDHIDHIVKVAGIDHVGLGSDYDGIPSVPDQLEDVSDFPKITQVLLDRGYSDDEIRKILGENLMRVMKEVEAAADRLK